MTAPIWIASPPEVHSTLLSAGPGPGPMLASAQSWTSLSAVYAETAAELAALLAGVQAGVWDGPSAETYVAAHAPYLAWLTQAAGDSAAAAARQETAAAAYTSALAAMPTLAELAVNHATHAVLLGTNFFGINTIPIALNEADYIRMWIQAATVMGTYHAVSTAAVNSSPQAAVPPKIVNAFQQVLAEFYKLFPLPADTENQVNQWLEKIGYVNFYNNVLNNLSYAWFNNPFFQAMFAGFDPYLPLLGNPLIFLTPYNIAFALGYPMDIGSYIAYLSQTFFYIGLDLTAAFASGNPATIGFTILFGTIEAVGTIITDTIALLKTLLEQTIVLITVLVPLVTAPLVTLAAGAVSPVGLAGLAGLAALPPAPPVAPPITPPALALTPNIPTSAPSPAPAGVQATAPAAAPATPPPSGAPPALNGAGVGVGMGAGMGMGNFAYVVGGLSAAAGSAAAGRARRKASEPDSAGAVAPATTPKEKQPAQRRRKAKAQMLGRGYEYMDLEDADDTEGTADPAGREPIGAVAASATGAGTQGLAGTAPKTGAGPAAGLTKLADDAFGGGPRMPMMPSTWGGDRAGQPEQPGHPKTDDDS
jgi:PPE-repeat protein